MEGSSMKVFQNGIADFFLKNSREGVLSFDLDFNCTSWNPAMEIITGIRSEECVGNKISDILPCLEKTGEINFYRRTLHGESFQLEKRLLFISQKGRHAYYDAQYYPLKTAAGEITGGIALLQETTRFMSVLQALEEAEEKYIQLVNQAPLPIVVFSEEEILFVNQLTLKLFGLKDESQIIGKHPLQFVSTGDREQAQENIQKILSSKLQEPLRHVLIREDGSELDAEIAYIPIHYMGKEAIQSIIRNITQEKRAYDELYMHKRLLSETQRLAKLGSYQLFLEDESLIWSDEIYRIFELDKNTFQPHLDAYLSFMDEVQRKEILVMLEEMKEGNRAETIYSHSINLSGGKRKIVSFIAQPVFNKKGDITSVVGSLQDITEQRKAEEELSQANQILNMHFENSPLGMIQLNNELDIRGWSKQAEKIFGWEASEVVGKNIFSSKLIHEDFRPVIEGMKDKLANKDFNFKKNNLKLYTKNGTTVFCELFISGISGKDGELSSIFFLVNDITARQVSEQAREEGQLEERKRIAREIHDGIGQMLIAIKYKLASLEDFIAEDKQFKIQNIESMMEQALEEVRSVSRNLAPRSVATMGLESSLRQMCEQIKKLTAIDLKFRYIGGEQEINHKIVNALYRIAQEATHNIIKHAQATDAQIQVFQGRNFIELKVEDNGTGMIEKGSNGMGLKNMEERAQLLGGRFQIHSDGVLGTTLIVNIPLEQNEN